MRFIAHWRSMRTSVPPTSRSKSVFDVVGQSRFGPASLSEPPGEREKGTTEDLEHLQHLAMKRDIKVTVRKGTQAGIVAGLSVMTGVIVAGPVGAVAGGAVGTAVATQMARDVVPLQTLLAQTPVRKRHEVLQAFRQAFGEEFTETIHANPELKLLLGGMTIVGVVRYAVDRNLLQNEQLERMDGILRIMC